MRAAETNLQHLLQGSKQYSVPLFQRPYTWGESNWETLWEDMSSIQESPELSHFLGPIVTLALPGRPDGLSPFIVIDGQQRLTTLSILLAALRDHLETAATNNSLAKELNDLYLINLFKDGDERFKILPTKNDLEIYKQIILGKNPEELNQLFEAYCFFRAKIGQENSDNQYLNPSILKRILLLQLTLVHITVEEKDNPYLIFESLNHKGLPLTQADLVRNYFFMRLPKERHQDIYDDVWNPVQELFRECTKKKYLEELTNAFWYYLRKDGLQDYVLYNQVYQGIKQRNDSNKIDLEVSLRDLLNYAKDYRNFRFPEVESEPKLKRWFYRFKRLDFTTSYPFLLNLYENFKHNQISLEEFEQILSLVESYFIRRLFAGFPTNALNKVFNTIYNQIDINKPVDSLRIKLLNYSGSQIWPDNEQFFKGILERPIYARRADRTKLILESINEKLSKECVIKDLTVEHIMPQKLGEKWLKDLGEDAKEHSIWVHTLGNLTLTVYNPELSNKPFNEKLPVFLESSVSLNRKYFTQNIDHWNVEAIKERGAWLAEKALEVWPR